MNELMLHLEHLVYNRRVQGSPAVVTSETWHQTMLVLITQLRRKRLRANLEDTLTDRILGLIIEVLPKALPQLLNIIAGQWSQELQAAMLLQPDLRLRIDKFILVDVQARHGDVGDATDTRPPVDDAVLHSLSLLLVDSAMQCNARIRATPQLIHSSGSGAGPGHCDRGFPEMCRSSSSSDDIPGSQQGYAFPQGSASAGAAKGSQQWSAGPQEGFADASAAIGSRQRPAGPQDGCGYPTYGGLLGLGREAHFRDR